MNGTPLTPRRWDPIHRLSMGNVKNHCLQAYPTEFFEPKRKLSSKISNLLWIQSEQRQRDVVNMNKIRMG